jgi:hypothetical protein
MNDQVLLENLYKGIWESSNGLRFSEGSEVPHETKRFNNPYYSNGDGYEYFEIRWDDNGAEVYGVLPSGTIAGWSNHPFPSLEVAKEHLVKTGHLRTHEI